MKGPFLLLSFLLRLVSSCIPADGSSTFPYYVLTSSTTASTAGSSCDPFPSLVAALAATPNIAFVTIILQSAAAFPAGTTSKTLTIIGNSNLLEIEGTVHIAGVLTISKSEMISTILTEFVFETLGSLILQSCTVRNFVSAPILAAGQVIVMDSTFMDNQKGVFFVLAFGAELNVSETTFIGNKAIAGAVFFVYPASGSGNTHVIVSKCQFQNNTASSGGSVLLANDLDAPANTATHTIAFEECTFRGHVSVTFQILIANFVFDLEKSQFDKETQIVEGTLSMTNVTLSGILVTNCAGPPLSFRMSGVLEVSSSNFTDVSVGPMLSVTGVNTATTLVRVKQVRLLRFTNMGTIVYGNLITALSATLWLEDVELRNFTAAAFGVQYLVNVALFSNRVSIYDGNVVQNVIGLTLLSSFTMNSTLFDSISSYGTMWTISASTGTLTHVMYRNIMGFWDVNFLMYTTNFFLASESQLAVDGMEAVLVHPGITLMYSLRASVTVANSRFTGPLGLTMMTILGSSVVFTNTTLALTTGRTVFKLLLGGSLDYDNLMLHDMTVLLSVISISSESKVRLRELSLINITSTALCKGQDYELHIGKALVAQSFVHTLVHFSIRA